MSNLRGVVNEGFLAKEAGRLGWGLPSAEKMLVWEVGSRRLGALDLVGEPNMPKDPVSRHSACEWETHERR
jgi:hypothetical protein